MKRLRIGFLLPRYSPDTTSHMPVVMRHLREAGVQVEVVRPAPGLIELAHLDAECDLYVLKKISGLALSLAGALHARGAAIVNPYPVTVALSDKVIARRILQAAGVPVPATYVASYPEDLAAQLDGGPLVVEPHRGTSGKGVHVVESAPELAQLPYQKGEPVFAQRYHKPEGADRKLYCIGERVFGVKKVFPRHNELDKQGEPFTPSSELREIALSCGRSFGIDLYGVDIVESDGKPYVVDMSSIPGFKGVPDAASHLAKYYFEAAHRAARDRTLREPAGQAGVA